MWQCDAVDGDDQTVFSKRLDRTIPSEGDDCCEAPRFECHGGQPANIVRLFITFVDDAIN